MGESMYLSGESLIVILFVGLVAGWLAGKVDVNFDPGPFFFSTILAALVVTLVSVPLGHLLEPGDD